MICGHCKAREVTVQHVRNHALADTAAKVRALTGYDAAVRQSMPVEVFVAQHGSRLNPAFYGPSTTEHYEGKTLVSRTRS